MHSHLKFGNFVGKNKRDETPAENQRVKGHQRPGVRVRGLSQVKSNNDTDAKEERKINQVK